LFKKYILFYEVSPSVVSQIEKLMCMTENKFKNHMNNIEYDILMLKYFNIQTKKSKMVSFMDVI